MGNNVIDGGEYTQVEAQWMKRISWYNDDELHKKLYKILGVSKESVLLDLCSGASVHLSFIPISIQLYIGIDKSEGMLKEAKSLISYIDNPPSKHALYRSDIEKLPLLQHNEEVTHVLLKNALQLIEFPEKTLAGAIKNIKTKIKKKIVICQTVAMDDNVNDMFFSFLPKTISFIGRVKKLFKKNELILLARNLGAKEVSVCDHEQIVLFSDWLAYHDATDEEKNLILKNISEMSCEDMRNCEIHTANGELSFIRRQAIIEFVI